MLRRRPDRYGAHSIAAAPGTHEAVFKDLSSFISHDARILDFGAFSGAMLQRFRDGGFTHLRAADLTNHLTISDVHFTQADLNASFAAAFDAGDFDAIIACEVIEHLDDPRHFLRECAKLLKPDGYICVSTPNSAFFEGRIKFFLTGELWGYGAKNYTSQRHISPLTREQFPLLYEECGFTMLSYRTAGSFATSLRKILTAPLWLPMRLLFGRHVLGETIVSVARKAGLPDGKTSSGLLWGIRRT